VEVLPWTYNFADVLEVVRLVLPFELTDEDNEFIDKCNRNLQDVQKLKGKTFVSRTTIKCPLYNHRPVVGLRVVIGNPLTTESDIDAVMRDQLDIIRSGEVTEDFDSADEMFMRLSKITEQWLQWRNIVVDRKQPRKMKVQANTIIKDEKLTLVDYPSNHDGVFQSWRERWSLEEAKEIDSILVELTKKDDKHFNC